MKLISSKTITRIIAILGFGVAVANAAPNSVVELGGKSYGNGVNLSATGVGTVSNSQPYTYKISGTVTGTGGFAALIPAGTSIEESLMAASPGAAALLAGTVPKPLPGSTSSILALRLKSTKNIPGVGIVVVDVPIRCEVKATGQVLVSIKNVVLKRNGLLLRGTIRFDPGSTFVVSARPNVTCTVATQNVSESADKVTVSLTRTVNPKGKFTVKFATQDGNGKAGVDYVASSGVITFQSGQLTKAINVPIIDNTLTGSNRYFRVVISDPVGANIGTRKQTNVFILNND